MRTPVRTWFWYDRRAFLTIVTVGLTLAACESAVLPVNKFVTGDVSRALGNDFSAWSAPTRIETPSEFNTPQLDGCPFISPDGKTFYMASNRPGGRGGLDIWVSTRDGVNDPWSNPTNIGTPVNSEFDDFCPTISRDGKLLYFVSRRRECGTDKFPDPNDSDVYVARLRADGGFETPEMLPCDDDGPAYTAVNSPFDEFSPFPQLDPGVGPILYFSSFRPGGFAVEAPGGVPDSDLYWSRSHGGVFGVAELIPAVNTGADDGQPNVGSDGRELFFYSTRGGGVGAADLYVSTRNHPLGAWSAPANLTTLNSIAGETRPSLSWDGLSLYFGSTRSTSEGSSDVYVAKRQRLIP